MAKVIHVYRTFFPDTQGGLEETIRQIAKGTIELGDEVQVFTLSKTASAIEEIKFEGIRVTRVPELFEIASCSVSLKGFSVFRELCEWADVVHFHFLWPFGDVLRMFVPKNTKTMVTYHSDIVRQKLLLKMYAPLMHYFLNSVDSIVSTSPNYLKTSPVLQRYKRKAEVIPIGLD
jgi:glycosyltransferase involved in cell wall biosynthesis